MIQPAGMRGHVIIWSPHMLLYSPNNGIVLLPVHEIGKDQSIIPPPGDSIRAVTTAKNGIIAVITHNGGLYYGRLDLEANVIKLSTNLNNPNFQVTQDTVVFFDVYGDLVILKPLYNAVDFKVTFQKFVVSLQQELTQTPTVLPCPVEQFYGNFNGKLYYIDIGASAHLTIVYVPTPHCPFFPVVTLTNSDALYTEQIIVEDGVTPEGYKKFKMVSHGKVLHVLEDRKNYISTVTVDLMERGVSCNQLNPQEAHIIAGCPITKHIRVMRNVTACSRGVLTEKQLRDNFTYTIPKEVYDPEYLSRPNAATEDRTVRYDYISYLCPVLVYHDMPWVPSFELWDGDKFVEVVGADFVMLEIHGMHNYQYLQTAKKAKCVSQPQDWISILNKGEHHPATLYAWNKDNYESCKDYNGPPLTDPDAEYQVLNKESKNRIVFSNYNGFYIFQATIVDPAYSYCFLVTRFSVFVYGAFPPRILPSGVLTAFFIAIFTALLGIGFLVRRNVKKKFHLLDINKS
ncbi:hypothetical protein ACEWY4_003431 [Coilia grayii]|uniref:Cation channel sperm-associated auxiliary subunit delta n=1 Tax=Coilia grayii TaxID=363190 RepID=A0ABD1KR88_9TELE